MEITSLTNPRIKQIVKLRDHSFRRKSGLTIVEGGREMRLALQAGVDFTEIYICPGLATKKELEPLLKTIKSRSIALYEVPKNIFAKISFGDRQEGILGVARPSVQRLENLNLKKAPLLVVVEGVEKPGNLGAILRSADAAGVDGLIVVGTAEATDLFNPNVIRASLGAIFCVPVIETSEGELLKFLRQKNITIFAATPQAKIVYTQGDYKKAIVIVVGSEEKGLSPFWLKEADVQVKIPMAGQVDSLNVSTSAAILMYEALRQRTNSPAVL